MQQRTWVAESIAIGASASGQRESRARAVVRALTHIEASFHEPLTLGRIAVLQYVYPLTAIVLDWAVYGRGLDAVQLAGVGLMAGALLVVKARQLR